MAEGTQPVDGDSELNAAEQPELAFDVLPGAAESDAGGDDAANGSGGDGAGGSSGGSGSGSGAAAAPDYGFTIPVYVVTSVPSLAGGEASADSVRDAASDSARPAPPEAETPPLRDLAAEAAREFSEMAARLGRNADVRDITLSPDGVPSAGVPMFERRTFWGGVVVASTPEAARAVARGQRGGAAGDRSQRPDVVGEFVRGLSGRAVRPTNDRRGFVTSDGDQAMRQFFAGAAAQQVREERVPEGSLERRGMVPQTTSQALREAVNGFKAQTARPKPLRPESERRWMLGLRRSPVMVAPAEMADELERELPGVTVMGYQPSVPRSLERVYTAAIDAVAAFQADQEAQRVKLAAALKQLWAQRVALLSGGRELSASEQARLGQIEQQMGAIINLVRFGQLAMSQLDTAQRSIEGASDDLEAAARNSSATARPGGAAAEISAGVAELEAATADVEQVGATASEVADAAHVTAVQTDAQIADWSTTQLEAPQPPPELVAELETLELPAGVSLGGTDEVTGGFDVTVDQPLLKSANSGVDAKPQSLTLDQTAEAGAELEPDHDPIPAPVITPPPDLAEPTVPDAPDFGDEPVIPELPEIEPLESPDSSVTEEQLDQAQPDDGPQPDDVTDSASRQGHREAEGHAAHGELPSARPADSADAGSLHTIDAVEASQPTPSAPVHSAPTMAFRPGEEDSDDGDGGGTAASMAKKDDDTVAADRGGDATTAALDAASVARDDREHRRVTTAGNGQYSADAVTDDTSDGSEDDGADRNKPLAALIDGDASDPAPAEPVATDQVNLTDSDAPGNDWVTPIPPPAAAWGSDGAITPDSAVRGPHGAWLPVHATADLTLPQPVQPESAAPEGALQGSGPAVVEAVKPRSPSAVPSPGRPSAHATTAAGSGSRTAHNASTHASGPPR